MLLLNFLDQTIVLVNQFMINITPNIFLPFCFLSLFYFQVNLGYFFLRGCVSGDITAEALREHSL